jgi:broad specificity phosphatase PhoE
MLEVADRDASVARGVIAPDGLVDQHLARSYGHHLALPLITVFFEPNDGGLTMQVQWARHGQNTANLTETFSHRAFDGDLTDLGRRQADDLGRRLVTGPVRAEILICSPLKRARQTAQIVGEHLGLQIAAELEDLREVNVGALDGRNDEAAWVTYVEILDAWRRGDHQTRFPQGENGLELADRLRRALRQVAAMAPQGRALVCAHGANLRAALPLLTGEPDPGVDLSTGGTALLRVDDTAGEVRLITWGDA